VAGTTKPSPALSQATPLAVCDLARVMRLPGTHNSKGGQTSSPAMCWQRPGHATSGATCKRWLDWHRPVVELPAAARPRVRHTRQPVHPNFARRFATKARSRCANAWKQWISRGPGMIAAIHPRHSSQVFRPRLAPSRASTTTRHRSAQVSKTRNTPRALGLGAGRGGMELGSALRQAILRRE
jgi:hypothetical protein